MNGDSRGPRGDDDTGGEAPNTFSEIDPGEVPTISNWYPTITDPTTATATAFDDPSIPTEEPILPSISASTSTTFASESNPTITSSTSDSENENGGGLSNSTKIAIAVPVSVVGAAIIAAILFFLIRRRRRRQHELNSRPVISTRELETSSSRFLPPQTQPVPAPGPILTAVPITRHPVPEATEALPPPSGTGPTAAAAAAIPATAVVVTATDLEWRTSDERAERPQSPFDHPHDNADALSVVSDINEVEGMMRARAVRDDDLSSVSSFEDEPRPSTNRPS